MQLGHVFFLILIVVGALTTKANDHGTYLLFAHLTMGDDWKVNYSVSKDGRSWRDVKTEDEESGGVPTYLGHPYIIPDPSGIGFILIGNFKSKLRIATGSNSSRFLPEIWTSNDLVNWNFKSRITDIGIPGDESKSYGSPKLYFDYRSMNYVLTWHSSTVNTPAYDSKGQPNPLFWSRQRIYYSISKNLIDFSTPKPFFKSDPGFDVSQTEMVIERAGGKYHAFFQDKHNGILYRTSSKRLVGGYSKPLAVSKGHRHFAVFRHKRKLLVSYKDEPGVIFRVTHQEYNKMLRRSPAVTTPSINRMISSVASN